MSVNEQMENDMPSKPTERSCNLPGCPITDDLTRGLCPYHWASHRGLADPDPEPEPAEQPVTNEVGGTPIPDEKKKG